MVKPVLHILFILISSFSIGQLNLVPNPSFENFNICPSGVSDFTVSNWYCPTLGTSDYFNTCNSTNVSIPLNLAGYQEAHSGNGYCGFASGFDSQNSNSREYIQVELLSELTMGNDYLFTGFFSLADSSKYCIKNLGITFSNSAIGGNYVTYIPFSPVQIFSQGALLCDMNNWIQVDINYKAYGGEKYLTIGLYFDDTDSDTEIVNPLSQGGYSYYYVDDISVIEMPIGVVPNVLTPNNDGVNDLWTVSSPSGAEFNILNRWGETIFNGLPNGNVITWNGKTNDGNECSEGVYFYNIQSQTEKKTGFIQLIR